MRSRRATETPSGCGMVRNHCATVNRKGAPNSTPDPSARRNVVQRHSQQDDKWQPTYVSFRVWATLACP